MSVRPILGLVAVLLLQPQIVSAVPSVAPQRTSIDDMLLSVDQDIDEASRLIVCRTSVGSLAKRVENGYVRLKRTARAAEEKLGHNYRIFFDGDIVTGDCRYPIRPLPSTARRMATRLIAKAEADLRMIEQELGIVGT